VPAPLVGDDPATRAPSAIELGRPFEWFASGVHQLDARTLSRGLGLSARGGAGSGAAAGPGGAEVRRLGREGPGDHQGRALPRVRGRRGQPAAEGRYDRGSRSRPRSSSSWTPSTARTCRMRWAGSRSSPRLPPEVCAAGVAAGRERSWPGEAPAMGAGSCGADPGTAMAAGGGSAAVEVVALSTWWTWKRSAAPRAWAGYAECLERVVAGPLDPAGAPAAPRPSTRATRAGPRRDGRGQAPPARRPDGELDPGGGARGRGGGGRAVGDPGPARRRGAC